MIKRTDVCDDDLIKIKSKVFFFPLRLKKKLFFSMAQTKKSAAEFIQDAFCPTVAVLCHYGAESVCRKNNLTFAELIQPFCHLPTEGLFDID